MFGVAVVIGYDRDGRRLTARHLWWANGRFGVSRSAKGTEEIWKAERAALAKEG